jgi:hypothetical protein
MVILMLQVKARFILLTKNENNLKINYKNNLLALNDEDENGIGQTGDLYCMLDEKHTLKNDQNHITATDPPFYA